VSPAAGQAGTAAAAARQPAEQDLLGLLTTARGGLIGLDLAELAHIPLREAEDILHTAQPGGRSAVGPASALTAYGGMRACWRRHRPEVRVADTIGAGEAFTPGLLGGLARRGLHAPEALQVCPPGALAEATAEVVLASALTCQLTGADPPAKAELSWLRPGRSGRRGS
jgi:sugar/nucleoside kinase (ribokinase family)